MDAVTVILALIVIGVVILWLFALLMLAVNWLLKD